MLCIRYMPFRLWYAIYSVCCVFFAGRVEDTEQSVQLTPKKTHCSKSFYGSDLLADLRSFS